MSENQQVENADSTLNKTQSDEPQNVGYDNFVIGRVPKQETTPEEVESEPEEPAEQEAQPDEAEPPAEQEGIAEDDVSIDAETVLSQLENLSEEDAKALSKEIGSRAAERISKLTARRKQAEEEAAKLRQQLAEAQSENPFEKQPPKVENNPFSDLETFEALQDKAQELTQIDEWADNLLWEHANADPDDVIVDQDGQELTKKQVREYQLNARKGIKTFLPARLTDLRKAQLAKQQEAAINEQVAKDLTWLQDEENETHKAYKKTLEDPVIKQIREKIPDIAPQLNAILAHAINSMVGASKKKVKTAIQPAKPVKPSPPSNPQGTVGSRPSSERDGFSKKLNELSQRYKESGDMTDFQALRAAQIANRQ